MPPAKPLQSCGTAARERISAGFGASSSPRLCPVGSVASALQPRKPRIHVCSRPGLEAGGLSSRHDHLVSLSPNCRRSAALSRVVCGTLRTDPGRGEGPHPGLPPRGPPGAEFLSVPCLDGAPLCGHLELSAGQAPAVSCMASSCCR